MAISSLSRIMEVFGSAPSAEEKKALFEEAALMTLARATSADTNIMEVEVQAVQDALRNACGAEISDADIRVAAKSELYQKAPLRKYLAAVAPKLDLEQRLAIVNALGEVIKADVRISPREIEFFNGVSAALQIEPAELVGLRADRE
ncbi:MAG: TerB family tellurite resistance protein [Gammaproteobacteria bacterium]|nr:TerB family tellurite resistance protein [Gammaproteobacteria bacterium]NND59694.1 hypothetical protein [Gammaproteobacteria bacterium]